MSSNSDIHLRDIAKSLERIERNTRPQPQRQENQVRTHSGHLAARVPIELDWMTPAIKTTADFIVNANGKLTIVVDIAGEDVDIVQDLLQALPVEKLQLSAVEP